MRVKRMGGALRASSKRKLLAWCALPSMVGQWQEGVREGVGVAPPPLLALPQAYETYRSYN